MTKSVKPFPLINSCGSRALWSLLVVAVLVFSPSVHAGKIEDILKKVLASVLDVYFGDTNLPGGTLDKQLSELQGLMNEGLKQTNLLERSLKTLPIGDDWQAKSSVRDSLSELERLHSDALYISTAMDALDKQLDKMFAGSEKYKQDLQTKPSLEVAEERTERELEAEKQTKEQLRAVIKLIASERKRLKEDGKKLKQIRRELATAQGTLEAIQAMGKFAAEQVEEAGHTNVLLAQILEVMVLNTATAAERDAWERTAEEHLTPTTFLTREEFDELPEKEREKLLDAFTRPGEQ